MKDNPKPAAGGRYVLDPLTNRPVPADMVPADAAAPPIAAATPAETADAEPPSAEPSEPPADPAPRRGRGRAQPES